jgi:cell division protein FtsB
LRLLIGILALLFVLLQYRLWVGEGSLAEVNNLRHEIEHQRTELERLRARNRALQAEVDDLREGMEAIEERARNELGMVKPGEVFYQVVEPEGEE